MGFWTDERIKVLKAMWEVGAPFSEIAAKLNAGTAVFDRVSRNGVIGKAHRLGLRRETQCKRGEERPPRPKLPKPPKPPAPKRTRRKRGRLTFKPETHTIEEPAEPTVMSTSQDDLDIPHVQRKTLLELTEHTCRWPVGEPGDPNFFFCGAAPVEGLSYCLAHCARAYAGVPPRRPKAYVPMRGRAA